jgi:cell division inhibitor SepF
MKGNLMGKFLNFVGLEEVPEEEEFAQEEAPAGDRWQDDHAARRRRSGLVSLPGNNRNFRVVVMHPRTLEDIADQIKARRPVIVNVDLTDERSCQRLLNFLSGVVYALDGGLRKVGEGIFLVTPANVEVATELEEDSGGWAGRGAAK